MAEKPCAIKDGPCTKHGWHSPGTRLCGCPSNRYLKDPKQGDRIVAQLHDDCTLMRHGTKYATLEDRACKAVLSLLRLRQRGKQLVPAPLTPTRSTP